MRISGNARFRDYVFTHSIGPGLLDLDVVKAAIRPDTILVSVMLVNNETGVIQPIREIAQLAHEAGALFMTDATQAVGKLPIDVDTLDIDLLAFSAHKFYGPKGIGGLFVRQRRPRKVKLEALLHGGGHERGLRSGTLNVPGIVGIGKAAELARLEMQRDSQRIGMLRTQLETALLTTPGTRVNGNRSDGPQEQRLYNVTNIYFENCDRNGGPVRHADYGLRRHGRFQWFCLHSREYRPFARISGHGSERNRSVFVPAV